MLEVVVELELVELPQPAARTRAKGRTLSRCSEARLVMADLPGGEFGPGFFSAQIDAETGTKTTTVPEVIRERCTPT